MPENPHDSAKSAEKPQIPAEMAQIRPEDTSIYVGRLGNGWLVTGANGMMFARGPMGFGPGMVAETSQSLVEIIENWAIAQEHMVEDEREARAAASRPVKIDVEFRPCGGTVSSAAELDALCGGPSDGEPRTSGGFLADPGGFKPL